MRRIARYATWWLAAVTGCTPLGLWVYDDPGFEVSRVRLQADPVADSTVVVALLLWNPNDYDISTARFELRLWLDDHTIGHYERDSIIPLTQVQTTVLALPFKPTAAATEGRMARYRSGTHRFLVAGRAIFSTPFGERRVRVAHGGAIAFGKSVGSAAGNRGAERAPASPLQPGMQAVWPRAEPGPLRP